MDLKRVDMLMVVDRVNGSGGNEVKGGGGGGGAPTILDDWVWKISSMRKQMML